MNSAELYFHQTHQCQTLVHSETYITRSLCVVDVGTHVNRKIGRLRAAGRKHHRQSRQRVVQTANSCLSSTFIGQERRRKCGLNTFRICVRMGQHGSRGFLCGLLAEPEDASSVRIGLCRFFWNIPPALWLSWRLKDHPGRIRVRVSNTDTCVCTVRC